MVVIIRREIRVFQTSIAAGIRYGPSCIIGCKVLSYGDAIVWKAVNSHALKEKSVSVSYGANFLAEPTVVVRISIHIEGYVGELHAFQVNSYIKGLVEFDIKRQFAEEILSRTRCRL